MPKLRSLCAALLIAVSGAGLFWAAPVPASETAARADAELVALQPPAVAPALPVEAAQAAAGDSAKANGFDRAVGAVNGVLAKVLFFSVTGDTFTAPVFERGQPVLDPVTGLQKEAPVGVPFIVVVLVFGAVFFTVWYRFINLRAFAHAIDVVCGKFDNPDDAGEITHFRALTSALSATVGLGNIAGVAIAIQVGGPGAVFWMLLTALFGMTAKFSSCTLAQLYRRTNADGSVSGGPMYYLDFGLREFGGSVMPVLGKVLGVMFALMVMGGSFGGGNMFQSNQSFEAVRGAFGLAESSKYVFGVVMAGLVAAVIIGGIKRIGAATSRIVPAMVAAYLLACLSVIALHLDRIPASIVLIFQMAFSENALYGGAAGVLVSGVKRAAFSNEAGIGSASIAHAAAKTDEPVREGLVAMLGPVIDTVIVCTMTALVVIVTGAWNDPELSSGLSGVQVTAVALERELSWAPYVLAVCVLMFAYSTMISWSYYGERGWVYLLDHFGGRGRQTLIVYRIAFVCFVFVGAVTNLEQVLEFSDMMILAMAFPNIIGSMILAPKVLPKVLDYWGRYTSGDMKAEA